MKIKFSKFGIILIVILFFVGLWVWKAVKVVTSTSNVNTPIVTEEITNESQITETDNEEDITSDDELVSDTNKPEYILISGIPASYKVQSLLIWLYNIQDNYITYLPYNYYIWEYNWEQDMSLGYLTTSELRTFFTEKWLNIIDELEVDRDVIFDLFTNTMAWDEYSIKYIDENNKELNVIIKSKAHLFNLLSKDNLNKEKNLEQLYNTLIWLLVENNLSFSEVFPEVTESPFTEEKLYQTDLFESVTWKKFKKEQINWKFFLVDTDENYLNALVENDLSLYQEYLDSIPEETEPVVETKKETLQEKLERLRQEKMKVQEPEKESLSEKLKRLREKKNQ